MKNDESQPVKDFSAIFCQSLQQFVDVFLSTPTPVFPVLHEAQFRRGPRFGIVAPLLVFSQRAGIDMTDWCCNAASAAAKSVEIG
jgi:hypothetical protein